jgi:hypothetical protein
MFAQILQAVYSDLLLSHIDGMCWKQAPRSPTDILLIQIVSARQKFSLELLAKTT